MKKLILGLVLLSFANVFAAQPTTTRAREKGVGGARHRVVKHTFTATTALDSIIILNENSNPPETNDLEVNRTIYKLQFNTAEATANNSDWDVLWQVSAVQNASATIFPVVSAVPVDWVTVETDQNDDLLQWVATFDAAAYKGMRLRAILAEANADSDAAVAIEAYFVYPYK